MIKELRIKMKPAGIECTNEPNSVTVSLCVEIEQAHKPKIVYSNIVDLLDFKSFFDIIWEDAKQIILKSLNQQSNNQASDDYE